MLKLKNRSKKIHFLLAFLAVLTILTAVCFVIFSKKEQISKNPPAVKIENSLKIEENPKNEKKIEESSGEKRKIEAENSNREMKIVRGILVVNKKYSLPKNYAPGENPEAKAAFLRLLAEMKRQNFPISENYSGFRSYDYQAELYRNYVAKNGQDLADTFSARAGHSEHQTGMAFDILNNRGQLLDGNSGNYDAGAADWLAKNAHNFGFIVRYQPGKEKITGYQAEPWHVRFVGDLAGEIYASKMSLEEFLNVEGGGY